MYRYLLFDDNGAFVLEMPVIIRIGATFFHEHGTYKVIQYVDQNGKRLNPNKTTKVLTSITCERIKKVDEVNQRQYISHVTPISHFS
jgi:hypothetical protein